MYASLAPLSLFTLHLCVFFSRDHCERERETETDKIIISGEMLKGEQESKKEREGTQQQNMNMKEEILCPLCLYCCVINLQIVLPFVSWCNPFCNKWMVTQHVCMLCILFAWPSSIEPQSSLPSRCCVQIWKPANASPSCNTPHHTNRGQRITKIVGDVTPIVRNKKMLA